MSTDTIESAKKAASEQAVRDHFEVSDHEIVGIGSGSTIKYVVEAIKETIMSQQNPPRVLFVPTGYSSRKLVTDAGLHPIEYESLLPDELIDVAFDGADEVDEDFNLIKGGGACLFQEKLVATRARKFVVVADFRKDQTHLLSEWSYVPIEVAPQAVNNVIASLKTLGCPNPTLRLFETGVGLKPVRTDQSFMLINAPFPPLRISSEPHPKENETAMTKHGMSGRVWTPEDLARAIKLITGVLDVGLFVGPTGPEADKASGGKRASHPTLGQTGQKPVAIYFGMQDGSVKERKRPT